LCSGPRHGIPWEAVLTGAHISLLEYPAVRSSAVCLDDLEDAFCAWVDDPVKPDVVDLGQYGDIPMVELSRRLRGSQAVLPASACVQLGLPPGVSIGAAVAELLHATVGPGGPRCRSFRAASYYLRGLARLGDEFRPVTRCVGSRTKGPRGPRDVR
jgi:hypothetical protein